MTESPTIWVVDDERSIRWVLDKALSKEGFAVRCFDDGQTLLSQLSNEEPDAIVSDIRMPGMDGLDLLQRLQQDHADIPVIIMTAHSDLESAVSSIKGGAFEYLPKPFEIKEAVSMVRRALTHRQRKFKTSPGELESVDTEIIGKAAAMQEVFRAIGRLSNSNITVLLNGQSGTGKELVAHALHKHSPRGDKPFIALNMAAIPRDLIESELFGHEKGSFTGAAQLRKGRFEQADSGTLLLDEIGDMPAETQTRLLRVLSDGEFYRVGGHAPVQVDVRIIAATHQNLEELVHENRFREDLYHRLNVIRIHIPKLCERKEDIPLLADHFLQIAAKELNEKPKILSKEAMQYLTQLSWPGNVRQLENTCRWVTVMATGREVYVEDLPPELLQEGSKSGESLDWVSILRHWADQEFGHLKADEAGLLERATPMFERAMIESALQTTGGRKKDAAHLLGWGRNTLTRKIKELDLEVDLVNDG
jgi:two-component system nitrogen regulation response regulator GlnG